MKRFFSRAAVAGLSAALVAGAALVAAPAASAATIGSLTFGGVSNQDTPFAFATSAACPAGGTNFQVFLSGGNLTGNPAYTGNVAGSTVGGTTTGPFTAPAPLTLAGFALGQGLTGGYLGAGTYTATLTCRAALNPTSLGDFVGQFTVTGTGASSVVAAIVAATPTTTTITSANPAAGVTNAPATFSATVAPAGAAGTVAFAIDGGTPVAAASFTGGVATSAASLLAAGTHSIVATFTGASGWGNSTSAAFSYVVTQAPNVNTTTNLTLSAATVEFPGSVSGSSAVTAVGGGNVTAGSVSFYLDGAAAAFATDSTGADGFTFPSLGAAVGPHTVLAVYSGATGFNTSTSPTAPLTVTAPAYLPDVQNITTSVPAGTLIISTPYHIGNPLDLGPMVLNATATEYKSFAAFTGISVADTRAGNLPYTVSAASSNLVLSGVASPTTNQIINAQNVGLTALTLTSTNSTPGTFVGSVPAGGVTTPQNFTGFDNPAAAHVAGGAAGTAGLAGGHPVLHANNGLGTTVTAGTLTITAPTNTLPGTYNGTVTFTIIGS